MDPSSSVIETCLGENVIEISSDKAERHGEWNFPEYLDTTNSGGKKETKAMTGTVTIYHELDPFLDSIGEEEKIGNDRDLLLDDLDFGDILDIEGVDVSQFVCKMGKNSRNKRKQLENYKLTYSDMGPSIYSLLEEERPVIEIMAYINKYKKILDRIYLDKMKLDGMNKEEEKAIIKVKKEALIEKEDPGAFVIPIRLE
nr:hypothetical protein [Tanacetum cinerariifolium]